jgi:hypothetical protein
MLINDSIILRGDDDTIDDNADDELLSRTVLFVVVGTPFG